MIEVYVIESITDRTWYTGIALNASKRLADYNNGKNRFTKGHRPWKIIYIEQQPDWSPAPPKREIFKIICRKKMAY
jgi:putative endonuclease